MPDVEAFATDKKVSQLTENLTPTADDLLYTVDTPGTSPTSRKIKIGNLPNAIPAAGTAGQVLTKSSSTDYAAGWATPATPTGTLPVGGTTGQVLTKNTGTDYDTGWQSPNTEYIKTSGGGGEKINTQATASGAVTLDLVNGNVFDLTLTGNVTGLTVANLTASRSNTFTLILRQDSTGSRTVAWMSGVKWASGTAPTISTGASKVDVLTFLSVNGGTNWLGFTAGLDMR